MMKTAIVLLLASTAEAWVSGSTTPSKSSDFSATSVDRRQWLRQVLVAGTFATAVPPAQALVKGNAPPPKLKPTSDRPKCTNVDECQAMAALAEDQRAAEAAAAMADDTSTQTTTSGIRYRDLELGAGDEAKTGDDVQVLFKVLKLGKRSYDGLSGEGTVVFSRGYALEDDEKKVGDKTFLTTLGSLGNIAAVNEAIPGMKVGGVRRFAILPDKGWRKPGRQCDGGPGGAGTGGDLKTDFVVVPTATMVNEEACFDSSKQPFPSSYAQQRRMAQRFDQSLIMEVELVKTGPGML
uniref:peptidylprolyl isomerase n=1 Tax=Entomoneis paludosa TaxID=265537 RepID=A0A7S2YMB9_9STRA|mmetsp:Transcript_39053/g.81087  ORF Transcript_39053/g.81087 Transcript_39053/m.81087 type:complete len:294 (+) Transcript_39053:89-970(+)